MDTSQMEFRDRTKHKKSRDDEINVSLSPKGIDCSNLSSSKTRTHSREKNKNERKSLNSSFSSSITTDDTKSSMKQRRNRESVASYSSSSSAYSRHRSKPNSDMEVFSNSRTRDEMKNSKKHGRTHESDCQSVASYSSRSSAYSRHRSKPNSDMEVFPNSRTRDEMKSSKRHGRTHESDGESVASYSSRSSAYTINGSKPRRSQDSSRMLQKEEHVKQYHRYSQRSSDNYRKYQNKNDPIKQITIDIEQLKINDSDNMLMSQREPLQNVSGHKTNEKLSIQFIKALLIKNNHQIIRILKDNEEELKNFVASPIRREHMTTVFAFVSKVCSIDFELTKQSFLNVILSSNEFIQNISCFIENVIELSRTESAILNNMKMLDIFFQQVVEYIPNEQLNNYNILITKAMDIFKEMDNSINLTQNFKMYKKSLCTKIEIFDDEIITYKLLSVFPTDQEIFNKSLLNIQNIVKGSYDNVAQYIDIQFKLLKEDYISGVRNGINQYLNEMEKKKRAINHDIFTYHNVSYAGLLGDDNPIKKVLHKFTIDSKKLKNVQWDTSKRLIHGSLLFFSDDNFKTIFMGVLDDRIKLDSNEYAAISVALIGKILKVKTNSTFVMIESRVFFEPYYQVCNTLKDIHPQLFPMCKYIVFADTQPKAPKYLKPSSHFTIENIHVPINNIHAWPEPHAIGVNSSQMAALQAALNNEFVVIQGPPGTGKTYLGIKLINILLDNKDQWSDSKSPIFVACYRNGAVDQILESLAKPTLPNSRRVVRLGGRSTCELLKNCNLKNTIGHRRDPIIQLEINELREQLITIKQNINEFEKCKLFVLGKEGILNHEVFTHVLTDQQKHFFTFRNSYENWLLYEDDDFLQHQEEYDIFHLLNEKSNRNTKCLTSEHPFVFISIKDLVIELRKMDDDLRYFSERYNMEISEMSHLANYIVQYNMKINTLQNIIYRLNMNYAEPDATLIMAADLNNLKIEERWSLYNYWATEFFKICETKIDQLIESHDIKLLDFLYKRDLNDGENLRAVNVDVIGATTTGAARLNKLLSVIKPKIVIIEEAAEVLEAHCIASLTAHCEHLILIGDHKQLKPSPASHESVVKYHMDVSLFERMILNGMECFTLSEQHRMRPEISALVTPYFYTNLSNHPSVELYPDVLGMKKNLFFLDHQVSQDVLTDNDSHQNKFEAKLTLQIANYIIQQGYEKSQVTILTLYIAQLLYMKSIKNNYKYLEGVDIQVVDNFQGEENDIILLSLVRSNSSTIGFLAKENRVCVALSRAKQGFIMVGNMETLQTNSQVWKEMRKILIQNGSFDSYLPLRCETHKRITKVNSVEDFRPLTNGGCAEECGLRLECGHICTYICHPQDRDHAKIFKCNKPCSKKRNCGIHDCTADCGQECPPCFVQIPILLDCLHDGFRICAGEILKCETPCPTTLECEHKCPRKCHIDDNDHSEIDCKSVCNKTNASCIFHHKCTKLCQEECGECIVDAIIELECGHVMKGICSEICDRECEVLVKKELICGHITEDKCHTPITEIKCSEKQKILLDCSHEVESECGVGKDEVECGTTVEKTLSCGHKVETLCPNRPEDLVCQEIVNKTLECGHIYDKALCSSQIDELICDTLVTKKFNCDHECAVKCGDPAPKCMVDVFVKDSCGHLLKVACSAAPGFQVNSEGSKTCKSKCEEILSCKHSCKGTCGKCIQGRVHTICNDICGKLLICGHKCSVRCWNDFHSCKNRCINACEHTSCRRDCGDICEKCMEPCSWGCAHHRCKKKCWEVCDRAPCSVPCSLLLECKHACLGLCGEPCPPLCLICTPNANLSVTNTNRYVLLEDCGHTVAQKILLELKENTVGLIRCPECSIPVVKTKYLKLHTKQFFNKNPKIVTLANKLYNNKFLILKDFSKNFFILNDVLKNTYNQCASLNELLHELLKRTVPIMQRKKINENKLGLKTLLFVCFYITDVLKMIKDSNLTEENIIEFLTKVNHLAYYLDRSLKSKISPREMYQFSQELIRLKCAIDLMALKIDIPSEELKNKLNTAVEKVFFALKEFTPQDRHVAINTLVALKKETLSNHQLLSADNENANKITEFFSKYYPLSYHSEDWLKCKHGHNFYSKGITGNVCPMCSNNTRNAFYYS